MKTFLKIGGWLATLHRMNGDNAKEPLQEAAKQKVCGDNADLITPSLKIIKDAGKIRGKGRRARLILHKKEGRRAA